ncbi:type III-B CRISPR module RAMP protein Cmr1 [Neomoorella humiferrea]
MMQDIILTCEVLTPMFLGGADAREPELRAPSIKGVLRFWWRALHGFDPLLKTKEGSIFGSAGEHAQKSRITLRIEGEDLTPYITKEPLPRHTYQVKGHELNILEYLAYGTYIYNRMQRRNEFYRAYIKPGYSFNLIVKTDNEVDLLEFFLALQYFCWFGSLGAKARNGFGSFKVKNVKGHLPAGEKIDLTSLPGASSLASFKQYTGIPKFSAFSHGARLFRTRQDHSTWDTCLAELGHAYRHARLSLEPPHSYKRRQYIGAPLIVNQKQQSRLARHAKPYFLRVHEWQGRYTGYILYLPSRYCTGLAGEIPGNLNLEKEDAVFSTACQEMNKALGRYLEVID